MDLLENVRTEFRQHFGAPPTVVVRAPGRVNIIGDHTDYNDGFVLPMSIDRAVWLAAAPRSDRRVCVYSAELGESTEFSLDTLSIKTEGWGQYVKGVAGALQQAGESLQGWQGVVLGDIPIGAGLSSSAALELAIARLFFEQSAAPWDALRAARLCQIAENEWVGVNCGIMDQLASALGRVDHALFIDCRSLLTRAIALPAHCAVVILDTGVRRGLVESAYNERREQCEAAAAAFHVAALRDVGLAQFNQGCTLLPELVRRRARHVVTENARVCAAAKALHHADADTLGQLMSTSHASLRDDFDVSCHALNVIVELAQKQSACYGARMTGAGFGGCAVALVARQQTNDFVIDVCDGYRDATGLAASAHICAATDGAAVIWQKDQGAGRA